MSDNNLNTGSLLSSLSSSSRPVRTSTPMTSSGSSSSVLPGSISSAQRQAINREFINNQTKQTNLLNSTAALNNLAMQNQGMMNQFNGSLMRQMGAIDAAANKITNAITNQTNQLVGALTNLGNTITESIKQLQDGLNNLFYDRASAYSARLMEEEDQNTYDEYAKNFVKTVFSEKITNLLARIEFVSLKEVKEQTLKYLMQNKTFASAIGLRSPYGSSEFNKMVPFTKDIADAILDSARHLLAIANGVSNINRDTPVILEHFGDAVLTRQDTLINLTTIQIQSINQIGNILDSFSRNYMNVNRQNQEDSMRGAADIITSIQQSATPIQNQADLVSAIAALRNQLTHERDSLDAINRDSQEGPRLQLELSKLRDENAALTQSMQTLQGQVRQEAQLKQQQIANQITTYEHEITTLHNLATRGFAHPRLRNVGRTREETEREIARIQMAIDTLSRGNRNPAAFNALMATNFGVDTLNNEISRANAYSHGISGRFARTVHRTGTSEIQNRQREYMLVTLREAINKNAYQTEENTKALHKSITAMDLVKTTLLSALNPMNIKRIGEFGYKLFKFVTPFFMYRFGLQLLTGKSRMFDSILPNWLAHPIDTISGVKTGDKTIGERAFGIWDNVKSTLAEFYNTHLKGIWENIEKHLATFKEKFISWIGKDWWMRIYDTWEAVKKYTSLGWDAFINPDTEKAAVAREQIVNKIRDVLKEVVVSYLLPGIGYSIAGVTAIKNIANPGRFLSNLSAPIRWGGRQLFGGFRTNVANFRESRQVLQDEVMRQIQRTNPGIENVRINLRNGVITAQGNNYRSPYTRDLTDEIDQGRAITNASYTLMNRHGINRQTATNWLRGAAEGGGMSYRFSRLVTGVSNGLSLVTRALRTAYKGLTWGFNIGTTLYTVYKLWGYIKERYSKQNADGMFKNIKSWVFYTVEKGWNTLIDAGKEIWNILPDLIVGLGNKAWVGLQKKWPTIWENIKAMLKKAGAAILDFFKNIGEMAWQWFLKKFGADDVSKATREKYNVSTERLQEEIKKTAEQRAKTNEIYDTAIQFIRSEYLRSDSRKAGLTVDERYDKAYSALINSKDISKEDMDMIKALNKTELIKIVKNMISDRHIAYRVEDATEGGVAKQLIFEKERRPLLDTIFGSSSFQNDEFEIKDGKIVQKAPKFSFNTLFDAINALVDDTIDNDKEALLALSNWKKIASESELLRNSEIAREIAGIETQFSWFGKDAIIDRVSSLKDKEVLEEFIIDLERRFANKDLEEFNNLKGGIKEVTTAIAKNISEEFNKAKKDSEIEQRQELAAQLKEENLRRKNEEKNALAAIRKANAEKAKQVNEEKKGVWDTVKSWFGFSPDEKNAGSLGVVAQWVQSGKFKQVMESAMGWIGDKIGGIIKFFKSQNYGKMFSDTMSGLGSATGGILSALYGADKADAFSRTAYNYAVKHNLKYAKAFFGGARKSILTSVENIAEHAAKTGQTVEEIRDTLRSLGVKDENQPESTVVAPFTGSRGLMIGSDNVTKGITANMFKDTSTGIARSNTYDSDTSLRISLASTLFPNEGFRTNEHEKKYPNAEYNKASYNQDFHSRMGLFAIDLPSAAAKVANLYGNNKIIELLMSDKTISRLIKKTKTGDTYTYSAASGGDIMNMKNLADRNILISKLNDVAHMSKDGKGIIDQNTWKEFIFQYIKATRWHEFGFDDENVKFIPAIYAEILDTAWWMGNGAARSVVSKAIQNTLNKPAKELSGKSIKEMLKSNYSLLSSNQFKFLQNIFNAALGRADAQWKRNRIIRNMRTLGIPSTTGNYALATDASRANTYSSNHTVVEQPFEYTHNINSEAFSSNLKQMISNKYNTSGYVNALTLGGNETEYNRVMDIFKSPENVKLLDKVASLDSKNVNDLTTENATDMAKLVALLELFIKKSEAAGETNTRVYNNFVAHSTNLNNRLLHAVEKGKISKEDVEKAKKAITEKV